MTYRAVVKYEMGATPVQIRREVAEGLVECAHELDEAGLSVDDIERAFEDAFQDFLFERESR